MSTKNTSLRSTRAEIARRLLQVRCDLFGEHGGPGLARQLGLPVRTWQNYESGVTLPGDVLLDFLVLTSVEPGWLLTGRGPQFRSPPDDGARPKIS